VLPPIQAYRLIDGRSAGDLELSGLELDASALVGTGEALDEAVAQARSAFILALASEALGAMERALELTAGYMNMREQFGQPIARFQALQHSLAEMACDVEMSRSLVGMVVEQTAREGGERDMAIAMAAIRIPRDAVRVCERAIQIHGGIGITEEYEAGHHYRRALTIQGLMNAVKPSATEIIERQAAMTALDAA
jgi:alkylation response protein AidB-like acyl-CoA dehydrogenase